MNQKELVLKRIDMEYGVLFVMGYIMEQVGQVVYED